MPAPYNYEPTTNPLGSFMQGLGAVDAIENRQFERQQREAAMQAMQRRNEIMSTLGPNAGYQDYMRAIQMLPEDRDALLAQMEAMDAAQSNALFDAGAGAFALLQADENGVIDPTRAIRRLEDYAQAFENGGDTEIAQQLRDSAQALEMDPAAGRNVLGMLLASADGDRFEGIAKAGGGTEATAFQRDFAFIRDTFGPEAGAEFARYGRGGVVSIPLGNGQTYVGPASGAPGAQPWRYAVSGGGIVATPEQLEEQRRMEEMFPEAAGMTPTDARPVRGIPEILATAQQQQTITAPEARVIRRSLGENGQTAFERWREENGIRVIMRTGTDANGRRVVQFEDGSVEYADAN